MTTAVLLGAQCAAAPSTQTVAPVSLNRHLVDAFLTSATTFSLPREGAADVDTLEDFEGAMGGVGADTQPPVAFRTCGRCASFVHAGYWRMYVATSDAEGAFPAAVVEVHPCADALRSIIAGPDNSTAAADNSTNAADTAAPTTDGVPLLEVPVPACAVAAHGFTVSSDVLRAVNATVAAFDERNETANFFTFHRPDDLTAAGTSSAAGDL